MTTLQLPTPPSVNNLFANKRAGGGRYKTPQYRRWLAVADMWFLTQKAAAKPVSGPYSAEIKLPASARLDIDNASKALLDYLVRVKITDDDRQCRKLSIERAPVDCCEITVRAA